MKKFTIVTAALLLIGSCNGSPKEKTAGNTQKTDSIATVPDTAPVAVLQTYATDLHPGGKVPLEKVFTDTVTFIEFDDNSDYFLCFVKKGKQQLSLVYDEISGRKLDFLRGDVLEIKWKMDSIWISGDGETLEFAEWLTGAHKIRDGKIEAFRKAYPKALTYWHAQDESYTETFQDYIYHLVEYYIAYSRKDLVKLHLKNPKTAFVYSIEEQERNGRNYTVIGLSNDMGDHSSIIQWLYLDSETRILYEYDLANDRLVEFP